MKPQRYISIIVLVLILAIGGWVGMHLLHPVSTGSLQLRCMTLPPDDSALQQWLTSQPQLMKSDVKRDNGTLNVTFKMQGSDAKNYADTVMSQVKQMGYQVNGYTASYNSNPFQ